MKIIKRSGTEVIFDITKIIAAVQKANKEVVPADRLTQDQVVARLQLMGLNISKSTYAKLETNRMNIKVSELVALRRIFSADYADFFLGLDDNCPGPR